LSVRLKCLLYSLGIVLSWLASPFLQSAEAQGFYLKAGDTVVFYGDSITEQNFYNQWVELYTVTRFPAMRIHFFGAGVGGDEVTGGSGGPIDLRLARDVFSHKPSVITVMLGMNDGDYQPTTDAIQSTYTKGYEHLLESIRTNAPGARITVLGPSPYDEVTRPMMFPGGYNAVLIHFADLDRDLARKFGDTFVNLNPPVVATLEKAQALNPLVARLIIPDRVHPEPLAHWVMAEALLKGWNAPSLVSSVTIDAGTGRVSDAQNAAVDQVQHDKNMLRWTEVEKSLPVPFIRENENEYDALLLQLTDIQQQLNQELLQITGLGTGQYTLDIDGDKIHTFSANELTKGINLADYVTPMSSQAQRVGWLVRDRDEAHYIHLRMAVRNADTGAQVGKPDLMDVFENSLEDSIYAEAAPKPHVFSLSLVTPQPITNIPAPAAAVGYNMKTFGSALTLGHNWQRFNFNGTDPAAINVTQNANGSVTISGGGNGYNAQLSTATATSTGLLWKGRAFGGGGYFEATLSWANNYNGYEMPGSTGWPGWWSNDIEHMSGGYDTHWPGQSTDYTRAIEPDFMEFWSNTQYGGGIHDWYGPSSKKSKKNDFVKGNTYDLPPGFDHAQPHKYGFLWVPATATTRGYAQYFFDRVHLPALDISWDMYNPASPPPPVDGTTAFSVLDTRHLALILGSGTGNPMTVYSVEVWQSSAANNITQ